MTAFESRKQQTSATAIFGTPRESTKSTAARVWVQREWCSLATDRVAFGKGLGRHLDDVGASRERLCRAGDDYRADVVLVTGTKGERRDGEASAGDERGTNIGPCDDGCGELGMCEVPYHGVGVSGAGRHAYVVLEVLENGG